MGCDTYTEAFNLVKEELKEGVNYGNSMIESRYKIQKAFEMIESKVAEINEEREIVDDENGPENPLDFEAVEAANAMDDFQRINLAEEEQNDLQSMIAKLNADQKRIFDMITNKMETTDNNADVLRCFVSGTGGTGKSFLIKILKVWVKTYLNKKVAVSAPTGIAAFNVNGLTIHRLLQLPVEHKQTPKYKPLSDEVLQVLRSDLKEVVLFIIDEVSMISNVTLTYIHLRLSEIFDTSDDQNGWFGKKHLVVFGDLLQLPPVREKSPFEKLSTAETNKLLGSLSMPNLWIELFIYDELTINMRQLNDSAFIEMLKRIRLGMTTPID
ncbi:unnamed protein product [Euphydryas editha]|uniref:ATP-dependent DNA helicase n=1 Tax=Euphydryas editha TaxID=104508 RepID=A0AAU9UKU0_EUPED|nr:unnamed protein product [Euphydryas editha]